MKVINCGSLEEIVSEKGEDNKDDKDDDIIFKQLTTIELASLKNLESFCSSKSCAFQFPSLQRFVVSACPKLKSFSQQKDMKPPKLQKIYVVHEKEKVESYWTNNLQETIRDIFDKKMFYKGMEELSVFNHLDLQQQWQSKVCLQEELFNNLKTLKLSYCEFEPYAIPSNVLSSFKNLRELEVGSCGKITGIFEMNDTKMKETSFQLKKLTLKSLPNVTHVWQPEKQGIIKLKNLQIMTVQDCENLSTLFPIALARDLKKLEELDVGSCHVLPNIVKADEAGTVDEQLIFPCLTRLELCYLPNLTDFCSHKFILEFPELNCLLVYDCNEQLELFQSPREENQNTTSTTKQPLFMNMDISKMEKLTLNWRHTQALNSWLRKFHEGENLESLNKLNLFYDNGKSNSNVPVELFEKTPNLEILAVGYYYDETLKKILPSNDGDANSKKILGKLKELYLFNFDELQSISGVEYLSKQLRLLFVSECPKLETIVLQPSFNLKELHIDSCEALLRLFTPSAAKMLLHLEDLYVENCKSLKEIMGKEQQSVTEDAIEFKQLERITLRALESLECFYSGNAPLELPSLIQLDIVDCSKMKVFSQGDVNLSRRIQVSFNWSGDLVFYYDDLNAAAVCQFLNQEHIVLSNDSADLQEIWTRKVRIPNDFPSYMLVFKHLTVDGCNFLSDAIIPSHLLPLLTNLEELVVNDCNYVKAIFGVTDTPTSDSITIVIPLKKLTLKKLATLEHVWNNDPKKGGLNFPCLEEVIIDECKSIKNLFPALIAGDSLTELDVRNYKEMEEIVAKEAANKELIRFHKLTKLMLSNLPKLRCVSTMMHTPDGSEISSNALLPSHLLSSLNNLKELVVWNCDSVEAIFDVKYSSPTEDPNIIDIPLKTMILGHLPTLRHVWKEDPKGGFRIPLLQEVSVNECKCITSLFPASVVFDNNIQKLDVRNCVMLEEIVEEDEAITTGKENNKEHLMMFPCLTTLVLLELPALRCICSGMHTQDWPESRNLVFADDYENSPHSNPEYSDDIDNDGEDGVVSPPKVVTPHLEQLTMDKKSVMKFEKGLLDLDLKNIKYLKLQGFNDIDESDPFSLGFFPNEPLSSNIEMLVVADSAFKEIFPSKMPEIIHSQLLLKELELRNLHMLESIGLEHTWVASSNLTSIKVGVAHV